MKSDRKTGGTQSSANTGRRSFLAGAGAVSAAVAVTTLTGAKPASSQTEPGVTSITDTLNDAEIAMLTPAARNITEGDAHLHMWATMGHGGKLVEGLTADDILSLEKAFVANAKRLWGLDEISSLAPNMINSAHAGVTACCCCAPCCCCAAVDGNQSRTRRLVTIA